MVELRTLTPEDWPLWRELRLQALAQDPSAFGSTLAQWQGDGDCGERWRARLTSVPFNVIAYVDEHPAGMVSGWLPGQEHVGELISMWVAPFARGKGVGDALIAAVVNWARELRLHRVVLEVREANAAAIALYKRNGFADTGCIDDPDSACYKERSMALELIG